MSNKLGQSWPEQDVIDDWFKENAFHAERSKLMELKTNVSAYRIEQQRQHTIEINELKSRIIELKKALAQFSAQFVRNLSDAVPQGEQQL